MAHRTLPLGHLADETKPEASGSSQVVNLGVNKPRHAATAMRQLAMAKKARTPIPEEVAAEVLFASDRTCCKCEERGLPIQIHHIDEDPGNNDPSNLAVLCLRCHDETQVKGGFARRLSPADVRLCRDNWLRRVERRRRDADALVVARRSGIGTVPLGQTDAPPRLAFLDAAELNAYLDSLPGIFEKACQQALEDWNGGPTVDKVRAADALAEVLRQMWLRLAAAFPEGHFRAETPERYIRSFVDDRSLWHRAMAEPHGYGTGGTIVSVLVSRGLVHDLEGAVIDTRNALKGLAEHVRERDEWMKRWGNAKGTLSPPP